MDRRQWEGGPRLLWSAVLSMGLVCLAGCISVQVGSAPPAQQPAPFIGVPKGGPASPSALQQARYSAGPPATTPMPSTTVPGTSPVGKPLDVGPLGPPLASHGPGPLAPMPPRRGVPTEITPTAMPPYVVEPPDILLLDTARLIPKPPYVVQPLDVLLVRVADPLPNQPIEGSYTVGPDGTINLGYSYGMVRVGGMTLSEVEFAIREQLRRVLREPQVAVGLAQFRAVQMVRGEHLVRPDGTVSLGSYGCVYVAGLTLNQVKVAIERHLAQYVVDPEINVDVLAYNSKVYYVITDGAGFGQQVYRLPITGKDTVLDAISYIQGLPAVASKKKIWVARPAPPHHNCVQVLPVDWRAITEGGATATNYQLFPGDRVYVGPDKLIWIDNWMAKILAPWERIFGITLLGSYTFQSFRNNGNGNGNGAAFIAPVF